MAMDEVISEMLNEQIEVMADTGNAVKEGIYVTVDPETRQMTIPEEYSILGVESDEKTERVWFQFPKVVGDNIDLTTLQLRVNYQNANNEADQYIVEDVEAQGDNIVFSWLLRRKVTKYQGVVRFIVCAVKVESDPGATVTNEWNTTLAQATVLEGLEIIDVQPEQDEMDVIAQLMALVKSTSEQAVSEVGDAKQSAISSIQSQQSTSIAAVQSQQSTSIAAVQSQQSTSIAAVQSASNNAVDAIEQAGDDTIASIPSTYTELYEMSEETNRIVKQIKKQIEGGEASDDYVVGLEVNYENATYTRLMGAVGKTAGEDFDDFLVFGGRKRCNVDDSGNIVAWYGDEDYAEDGTNGQVMVYQPKVYYRVVPVKLQKIEDGEGYRGLKMQYYVTDRPLIGFKLHPAFCMGGKESDYILLSAYEGSLYDTSALLYVSDDSQVAVFTEDKLCSLAGMKPISGKTQNLTRANAEQLAANRGVGWHIDFAQTVALEQLMELVEMGTLDMQTAIGQGVVSVPDTPNTDNNSIGTGATSSLGNTTGVASGTSGQSSVSYRGRENIYGNIWKFVNGINIYGDGSNKGGIPYVSKNLNFAESKNTDNYEKVKYYVTNTNGYIKYFGYDEEKDYLFFATDVISSSWGSVSKDYTYVSSNLNGYRVAPLGGNWTNGSRAGLFAWSLGDGVSHRHRNVGCRLVFIP